MKVHDLPFIRQEALRGLNALVIVRITTAHESARDQVLCALIAGVTSWVKTTPQGAAAWKYSSEDLNIGDLSSELDDPRLLSCLRAQGIETIEIPFSLRSGDEVSYDKVLVDEAALETDEPAEPSPPI